MKENTLWNNNMKKGKKGEVEEEEIEERKKTEQK